MCAWGEAEGSHREHREDSDMGKLALDLTLLTRAHIANIFQMVLQHPDHQVTSHLSAHVCSNAICQTPQHPFPLLLSIMLPKMSLYLASLTQKAE